MKATLDTNIIMHLYEVGLEEILFSSFEEVYVYDFIINAELKKHGSKSTIDKVEKDIRDGRIIVISKVELLKIGMWSSFERYVYENRIIYNPGDLGEIYAIALAKTYGLTILATDDTKMYGPHYMLINDVNSEIIPLAFYELFLLMFLEDSLTDRQFIHYFDKVNSLFQYRQNLGRCINRFYDRFWDSPINPREKIWFERWCASKDIDCEFKYDQLWDEIEKH